MFGSAILDVAIGMAFLFLLLSLIASAAQEVVALIVQARAANLLRGIRSMLCNDTLPSGQTYLQAFYNHGLVRSLYQVPGEDYIENGFRKGLRQVTGRVRLALRWLFGMRVPGTRWDVNDLWMPAYISSRVFALALRDILKMQYGDLLPGTPPPTASEATGTVATTTEIAAAGTPPASDAAAAPAAPAAAEVSGVSKKDASSALAVVLVGKDAPKKLATEALRSLVEDADGDAVKLQQNLENWYNDTMDRVSGWYKRYTQNVLLVIGLLLAIVFNVNSIRIVRALWVDKDARTALASEADAYMKQHQTPPAKASATEQDSSESPDFAKFGHDLRDTVDAYHGAADQLLPVGWKTSPKVYLENLANEPANVGWHYFVVLLGWMVTAVGLSYGAPFWFDTLNKFMVVRSTIKPQEKSQVEPSKD